MTRRCLPRGVLVDLAAWEKSYWRMRVQQAQAAITAADQKVRQLEARSNEESLMGIQGPADCRTLRLPGESFHAWRDRALAQSKKCEEAARKNPPAASRLEDARREAAAARKALDDSHEEARRAGALPGWLR